MIKQTLKQDWLKWLILDKTKNHFTFVVQKIDFQIFNLHYNWQSKKVKCKSNADWLICSWVAHLTKKHLNILFISQSTQRFQTIKQNNKMIFCCKNQFAIKHMAKHLKEKYKSSSFFILEFFPSNKRPKINQTLERQPIKRLLRLF